jgi:hypothetical protein
MSRKLTRFAIAAMWLLAIAVAIGAARYFLNPVPLLVRPAALALARHPVWLLLHIAGGVVALLAGPFQFLSPLRASHPAVHRATGYAYLAAVLVASCAGLRLAPDTAQLMMDGLNERQFFELPLIGMAPSALGLNGSSGYDQAQFFPVVLGFAALAICWFVTSGSALLRARQRRFSDHRAWMMRSYSLTFAAVTVRLVALPLLLLTRSPVVAMTVTFWSWVLNLMVAEWLAQRMPQPTALRAVAGSA